MRRAFNEHIRRRVDYLDGVWSFIDDPNDCGLEAGWNKKMPASAYSVSVPSVWNTESRLLQYEGKAWYSKTFSFEGGNCRICFDAVMTECTVWLDGQEQGSHYGGYTAFDFIVKSLSRGVHTLTVCVDNRFGADSIPQKKVDFYHYGGITRSVSIEKLGDCAILGAHLDYKIAADFSAVDATLKLSIVNLTDHELTLPFTSALNKRPLTGAMLTLPVGKSEHVCSNVLLEGIKLWSPKTPKLYNLYMTLGDDDLTDRVGFRDISVKNGKIYLNGEELELRGVCRHEDHPDFGMAFPGRLMDRDLEIIKNLSCNFIRGSHYPNSKVFLDLLDENGIMFWSEIPIWGGGFAPETLVRPLVLKRGLDMLGEMKSQYFNHPSIIMWGLHNEIRTDLPQGKEMSRVFYSFMKEDNGNRPLTFATDHPLNDICLEYCDIIGINKYYGWYEGDMEVWADFLEKFREYRRSLGMEDKPVIMSEFGCAALYGYHTFDCLKWTEEYQAKLLTHTIELFHKDPMIVGFSLWQYCDIRTAKECGNDRARSYNNKGIVSDTRKPKLAYLAVKKLYEKYAEEESENK